MNFVLDEFASIPIPDMDKALATYRSRNIRFILCIQSLAMLKTRYEEPEALLANCASVLYLGSTELELLKQLETKLGTTRVTPDGVERPLCSQAELMTLEKAWDHKEAIYMNLSENIRYCTMIPAIEAYETRDEKKISDCEEAEKEIAEAGSFRKVPEVKSYSVADFAADIINEVIRTPFTTGEEKPKAYVRRRRMMKAEE